MGIFSIILIAIWAWVIFDGIYGIVKGYFRREREKAKNHEPNAYRKWVRLSSAFLIICGALNVIWSILNGLSEVTDSKYVILIIITVAAVISAVAVAYIRIVKPADKANGIESRFDKTLEENKKR